MTDNPTEAEDRERRRRAEWRAANRSKILAQKAKYRAANREKIRARAAIYREANREKCREMSRSYYWRNVEKLSAYYKIRNQRNPKEISRKKKIYYDLRCSTNREKHGKDLFSLISGAVPKTLPAHIRDDVIGTVVLQIIDHKVDVAKIKELVKSALTTTWGQSDWFKHVSIDAPIGSTDDLRLGDMLASDAMEFMG